MKIVLYSAYSEFPNESMYTKEYPDRVEMWEKIGEKYKEHEIIIVTKIPASYIYLDFNGKNFDKFPRNVKFEILPAKANTEEMADFIYSLSPDIAVDVSLHSFNYDWEILANSVVAEILKEKGVNVVSNTVNTALTFFNKWKTYTALKEKGFNVANAIYVNNNLLNADKDMSDTIAINQYKEYVFHEIKKLKLPIVIKCITGTNSSGIYIAKTIEEAQNYLISNNLKSDFIVEEFIKGKSYGVEIRGIDGNYDITSPFLLGSEEGLTQPLTNVRIGPVTNENKFNFAELKQEMLRLANEFKIFGHAQVDLIYDGEKFYIIEINLRWSGMTRLTCVSKGINEFEMYIDCALQHQGEKIEKKIGKEKYSIEIKLNNPKKEQIEELVNVKNVNDLFVIESSQLCFYCVIFGGFDTIYELLEETKILQKRFSNIIDDSIIKNIENNINDFS